MAKLSYSLLQDRSTLSGEEEKEDCHSPVENGSAETLVQEVAKQLQVGLRIIEPIPEEQEEDLEASNNHLVTKQSWIGPVGGEHQPELEDSKTPTNKDATEENQAGTTENDANESKTGLKEVDTISRVLGEVIAKRKQVQASST